MCLGTPPADPRLVALVRVRDAAIDPPKNIHGAAVDQGDGAPPALRPLTLLAWPASGRGAPPAILPPIFKPWRSSGQSSGRGMLPKIQPPNIYGLAVEGGRTRLRSPLNLVAWLSTGREAPHTILPPPRYLRHGGRQEPQHSRRGGRLGRGCASDTPSAIRDPRPVVFP